MKAEGLVIIEEHFGLLILNIKKTAPNFKKRVHKKISLFVRSEVPVLVHPKFREPVLSYMPLKVCRFFSVQDTINCCFEMQWLPLYLN